MALNTIILYGRLVRDPEYRQTSGGVSVARFVVACDRKFVNQQTGKREADFIEVQAWKQAADFVSKYFHKGDAITVEGSLRNNNWEKDGVKHYSYVVLAEQIGFGARAEQNQNAQPQQRPPQQSQQQRPAQGVDLSSFTDILSEGELPF